MSRNRTLVVLYPGCIAYEVMLACEILNAKLPVDVITPNGEDHHSSNGMVIRATAAYGGVDMCRYEVVLVPGGDTYDVLENVQLMRLLQALDAQGAILGAICAGPILLGKAGVLRGRRFTHGMGELFPELLAPLWQTGQYVDDPVVIDGQLITAKPHAHIDFGVELARLARAIVAEDAAQLKRYYKGLAGTE
jgi:putative intracellular protease/amidase